MERRRPFILVADDDPDILTWVRRVLNPLNVRLFEVGNGEDLLTFLASFTVDLVVTDIRMPGLSGLQATASAYTAGVYPPFLVISAYTDMADGEAIVGLPGAFFLKKPLDKVMFMTAVRALLRRPLTRPKPCVT